jgi:hypothetical protein
MPEFRAILKKGSLLSKHGEKWREQSPPLLSEGGKAHFTYEPPVISNGKRYLGTVAS